jgi:hypothetical protein
MKFDDLYNKVFVSEQEEVEDTTDEVADPNDPAYDVEPMPLPETPLATDEVEPSDTNSGTQSSSSLNDYVTELESFADKMNCLGADCLNSLVSKLNQKDTPFEGIRDKTSSDIVNVASKLRDISEVIKSFLIHAAKN